MAAKVKIIHWLIWKLSNAIARLGCWLNGYHIAAKTESYTVKGERITYRCCLCCGLWRSAWRLPNHPLVKEHG